MKALTISGLALLIALPLAAQNRGRRPGGGRGFNPARNVIALLLEKRADLELDSEQVARLDQIRLDLDSANAPYVAQLEDIRSSGGRPDRSRMQELFGSFRSNQNAATEAALALLNDRQKDQARSIIESARPRGRPGQRGRGNRGRRPGGGVRP